MEPNDGDGSYLTDINNVPDFVDEEPLDEGEVRFYSFFLKYLPTMVF